MPKKLLVADDSLTIQKVIRLALSGAASGASDTYEIQTVSDGNDAIQQISLFRPDVVLIDVSLPGKSAFEVKRATNQHRDLAHVRFVLMSSAFEKVDEIQVEEVAFHGRLTKPFDPAHLREVLSQVLAKAPAPTPAPGSPTPPPPRDEPSFEFEAPPPIESSFMPELPGAGKHTAEPESDIRNLTESTIRMSGLADLGGEQPPELPPELPRDLTSELDLPPEPPSEMTDDFQWNVEEHSLKPPSNLDAGDSTFPLAPPPKIPNEHSRFLKRPTSEELELTPPPAHMPHIPDEPYAPEPRFGQDARSERQTSPRIEIARTPTAPSFDQAELEKKVEEMTRREVHNAIRKAVQETLPDIVERVIKEEIHKLLQDSP